ncbi:hypothetical protein ACFQ9V_06900 [Leifsonia sp. NPDC056665]|uniref:hypothetical protein n=1 Tax=Leifsonia sp. NPDC056665 TaxID=3345901 RepID=UPI0036B617EA
MTAVSEKMSVGAAKQLVDELRDQFVIEWSLRQRAPVFAHFGFAAAALYTAGGLLFVVWILSVVLAKAAAWTWAIYVTSLVALNVAQATKLRQIRKRRAWIEQERQWRGLSSEIPEATKTMSRTEEARLLKRGRS